MATNQGLYYYTKEEIDELIAAGPAVDDFTFTLTRVGFASTTLTGKRIKIADDLYMYLYRGSSSAVATTSTGNKNYHITWNPAFSAIYGASLNAAFSGQASSTINHVSFQSMSFVDFYIYSSGTSGDPIISFVVIGRPSS